MTKQECIIVSAYTGFLLCDFDDMHKYIEEKLKRPVWTHELADEKVVKAIREAVKPDLERICGRGARHPQKKINNEGDGKEE